MTNASVVGGCFCGAVRYEARGKPTNSMVCHCHSCRRAAGAPVVAWLTFARTGFRFTQGSPVEFKSSDPVSRAFCGACGTALTYRNERDPETIDVTTASLDEPATFPPTHHSWLEDDIAWVKFGDGLPAFRQWRAE
jgi:hypothetical protein